MFALRIVWVVNPHLISDDAIVLSGSNVWGFASELECFRIVCFAVATR